MLLRRYRVHTGARTAFDIEQQAGPVATPASIEDALRAGTHREGPQQQIQCVADRVRVGERSVITDAFLLVATHDSRSRVLLIQRDGEVGVTLVIAVPDVVPGAMLLYEVELQVQRLDLAVGHDPLDLGRRLDHRLGPRMEVGREVVGQPVPQNLGLAHVYDPAHLVPEQVDAWCGGDGAGLWTLEPRASSHGSHCPPCEGTRWRG